MAPTTMSFPLLFSTTFVMAEAAAARYGMILDYSPREFSSEYLFGSIAKRQEAGACNPGFHSCLDVQDPTTLCCVNTDYCYLAPAGIVSCCAIGSDCQNQCSTATGSSEVAVPQPVTISGTATTTYSCSARSCAAGSEFLCPSSLGGQCCGFASTCASNGQCISTTDPATVIPPSPTFTGCTTSQFSCPALEGGGCCNNDAKCTASHSTLLCVATATIGSGSISITPTAIRIGPSGSIDSNFTSTVTSSSHNLSPGAKAGIGIGVALSVILITIGILLFAISRRRSHRRELAESSVGGGATSSKDTNGEKRLSPRVKNERDYFGPAAKAGPYTETTNSGTPLGSPDSVNRGVPLSPQGPTDIAAPVEIGGSVAVKTQRSYVSDIPEKPEFRIELP